MTTTTYYNLNIVEGTDIVNPLTVDNPNYEKIDEVMHNNAVSGVTLATEITNATVHAIIRENSECAVIRFIATSNWKAGDTVTVDGVPVTALLPSGETLPDGAYVINANVLCILTGTNLTVYAERKKTDKAIDIAYKGTNVSMELDKLNSNLQFYDFSSEITGLPTGIEVIAWVENRIVTIKITVRDTANSGSHAFTIPEKYRSYAELYFTVYNNSSNKNAIGFVNGTRVNITIPQTFVETWMSCTYALHA